MAHHHAVAYFSMEIAVDPTIPTYSGGLGVLAGDTVRAAADLRLPFIGVTLLYRKGYLHQTLDASGWQIEAEETWDVAQVLTELPQRITVTIEGRNVRVRAWRREVAGVTGATVPVYFLDTDLPENSTFDRSLTDWLYGGDDHYRICQEVVLGVGGVRMLRALGHEDVGRYHMNEGHAALLGLELLEREAAAAGRSSISWDDVEAVRARCVFTTHTPVAAGHDKFPLELMRRVIGTPNVDFEWRNIVYVQGLFNLTYMALSISRYVNGVAKRHAEISRKMFAQHAHAIDAITNGVHAATWTCPPFQKLFDRHISDWRSDSFALRHAHGIPREQIAQAHREAKDALLRRVSETHSIAMDPHVFTIGFARRATAYKRADLLFQDIARLKSIARTRPLQLVFAGKAHPRDIEGKQLIQRLHRESRQLGGDIKFVYLADYDMRLAQLVTSGVDLWLNTPQPPLEASGTSGMKAALNGVPSLSVLDGWWIEGHIEGVTGWSIGADGAAVTQDGAARELYDKLERTILPLYDDRPQYLDVMAHCISLNGSFFNAHRMLQQYVVKAYFA